MHENISPPIGKTYVRTDAWGNTNDIIKAIMDADDMAPMYTEEFARSLNTDNINDTCSYLWQWVRSNIRYKEDGENQNVQLPGALYKNGYGDCKSMTLFTASVIKNLYGNIYKYRFISQDADQDFHHVYLVVEDEYGNDIILDCVENYYDLEVPHVKQKDMYPKGNKINGLTLGVNPISTKTLTLPAGFSLPTSGDTPVNTQQHLPPKPPIKNPASGSSNMFLYGALALGLYLIFKK